MRGSKDKILKKSSSMYDHSKAMVSDAEKKLMEGAIVAKRAFRQESQGIDGDASEVDEDDSEKEDFVATNSVISKNEPWQMPVMSFPASHNHGALLCLERMDHMTKQIDRLRTSHPEPASPKGSPSFLSRKSIQSLEEKPAEDSAVDDRTMEEALVHASQPNRADLRLLEMLGPEGQEALFNGQQRICEYFRHKYAMLDANSKSGMVNNLAPDDDTLKELSSPVSPISQDEREDSTKLPTLDGMHSITEDPLEGLKDAAAQLAELSTADGCAARRSSVDTTYSQSPQERMMSMAADKNAPGLSISSVSGDVARRKSQFAPKDSEAEPSAARGIPGKGGKYRGLGRMVRSKARGSQCAASAEPAEDDEPQAPRLKPSAAKKGRGA